MTLISIADRRLEAGQMVKAAAFYLLITFGVFVVTLVGVNAPPAGMVLAATHNFLVAFFTSAARRRRNAPWVSVAVGILIASAFVDSGLWWLAWASNTVIPVSVWGVVQQVLVTLGGIVLPLFTVRPGNRMAQQPMAMR